MTFSFEIRLWGKSVFLEALLPLFAPTIVVGLGCWLFVVESDGLCLSCLHGCVCCVHEPCVRPSEFDF
jgi:hypothetical protein